MFVRDVTTQKEKSNLEHVQKSIGWVYVTFIIWTDYFKYVNYHDNILVKKKKVEHITCTIKYKETNQAQQSNGF